MNPIRIFLCSAIGTGYCSPVEFERFFSLLPPISMKYAADRYGNMRRLVINFYVEEKASFVIDFFSKRSSGQTPSLVRSMMNIKTIIESQGCQSKTF